MRQFAIDFLPPSVNNLTWTNKWRWREIKQKFEADLAVALAGVRLESIVGPVAIEVVVADGRGDWDSRLKCLCDGMQALGCFADDAQIVEATVVKAPKATMDHAVLVRYGCADVPKTEAIELWWGSEVKTRKPARKGKIKP